ncbi:MAG: carbohydrate-binding domain-containing protein [Clostridia bacterium]|nr:carbohydrate-binding domain-containing protein [Clostridia bacterium]
MTKTISRIAAAALAVLLAVLPIRISRAETGPASEADLAGATVFTFSNGGIAVAEGDYSGYSIRDTVLKIEQSGTYVLTGSCADGSVTVKKQVAGVYLVLDGLTLSSSDTAPLCFNKASGVTVIAADGTVNSLSDTALNNDGSHAENENAENAVIKCKDGSNVTLCGSGTLNVTANGKNGIRGGADLEAAEDEAGSASSLTIGELTLNVTAVNDAIKSGSVLNILSGNITVSADDDGVKSDYTLNVGTEGGEGPTVNVQKSYEGIEAAVINIRSGSISVSAADDGLNAANSDLGNNYPFELNILGGSIYVDASGGDGVDSNGTLTVAGGNLIVFSSSRNDNSALDSEKGITLTGGAVLAVGSSGMAEGPSTVSQPFAEFGVSGMGGTNIGFHGGWGGFPGNVHGGGQGGSPGGMTPPGGQGSPGQMPGGMTPPGGDGGMTPPDGTPPAGGDSGMTPPDGTPPADAGSVQPGGMAPGMGGMTGSGSISISAGDTVAIGDENGNTLIEARAPRAADYVLFTSPSLEEGAAVKLLVNGSEAAITEATTEATSVGGGNGMHGQMGGMHGGMHGGAEGGTNAPYNGGEKAGLDKKAIIALIAGGALLLGAAAAAFAIARKKAKKNTSTAE